MQHPLQELQDLALKILEKLVIGDDNSSFFVTLDPTTSGPGLTADRTLTLPNEDGTLCVQESVTAIRH